MTYLEYVVQLQFHESKDIVEEIFAQLGYHPDKQEDLVFGMITIPFELIKLDFPENKRALDEFDTYLKSGDSLEDYKALHPNIDLGMGRELYAIRKHYGTADYREYRKEVYGTRYVPRNTIWEPELQRVTFASYEAPPIKAIAALAEYYPDIAFEYSYASNRYGWNVVKGVYGLGEEPRIYHYEDLSVEAVQQALKLWKGVEEHGGCSTTEAA